MIKHVKLQHKVFLIVILLIMVITACTPLGRSTERQFIAPGGEQSTGTNIPKQEQSTATNTPEPTVEDTPASIDPVAYWVSAEVPARVWKALSMPDGLVLAEGQVDDAITLGKSEWMPVGRTVLGELEWVFALVAPFKTVQDDVNWVDLQAAWTGNPQGSTAQLASLAVYQSDYPSLVALLGGTPGGDEVSPTIRFIPDDVENISELISAETWAIVPFDRLRPEYKVIAVDGVSAIDDDFSEQAYGLKGSYSLYASAGSLDKLAVGVQEDLVAALPLSNRDEGKMTSVVMTGVTALVRATAYVMETQGILFPGRDIVDWLRAADITHISNEVSFYKDCPYPDPYDPNLSFCSRPGYIDLLEFVGADVVEMTGNHNNDASRMFGVDVVPSTLALYDAYGMSYFGGGVDLEASMRPAVFTHNGNKIAFIGCNAAGPDFAWATESIGGSAPCGDLEWMAEEIARLREDGYLPIATFQYYEDYNNYASERMKAEFGMMAEAGAVIVNGSQAHTPKTMDFVNGGLVHYGLGNLFFDQMTVTYNNVTYTETRNEFIQRHIFYDGRYVSTELLTARLEDWARPRPMTLDEREGFLTEIFGVR